MSVGPCLQLLLSCCGCWSAVLDGVCGDGEQLRRLVVCCFSFPCFLLLICSIETPLRKVTDVLKHPGHPHPCHTGSRRSIWLTCWLPTLSPVSRLGASTTPQTSELSAALGGAALLYPTCGQSHMMACCCRYDADWARVLLTLQNILGNDQRICQVGVHVLEGPTASACIFQS